MYGKLAGDSTLTNLLGAPPAGKTHSIYDAFALPGAGYPLVVLNKQSGVPTYAMATTPALETDMWLVKAIDKNIGADTAEAIATRLNTLLTDGVLSISGATQLYLRRQSDVDYEEEDDGVVYRHVGSLYRLVYA
jgi:hypothetical protein